VRTGLVVEPLTDEHDVACCDCGNRDLTDWLRNHALHALAQGTRTYVLVEQGRPEVLGYFALAPHFVEREELPRRTGRGAPRQVPAILLAKLALATSLQGQGLGRELLIRALTTVVGATRVAGGKVVVVDAVDETAAAFYEAHDFAAVPGNPRRLVMKLSTVAKALGRPWP
jgi:GNAT superfamily N-acetyltransferase